MIAINIDNASFTKHTHIKKEYINKLNNLYVYLRDDYDKLFQGYSIIRFLCYSHIVNLQKINSCRRIFKFDIIGSISFTMKAATK